jgi:hypothetical protein
MYSNNNGRKTFFLINQIRFTKINILIFFNIHYKVYKVYMHWLIRFNETELFTIREEQRW